MDVDEIMKRLDEIEERITELKQSLKENVQNIEFSKPSPKRRKCFMRFRRHDEK